MANRLKMLRKENNEKDKLLSRENSRLMTDMVVYLRSSSLCDYDIEVIRRELFGMIYEAQLRGETADQAIGSDYKGFCDELMESGRQKSFYEKVLELAYVLVAGLGILFVIETVFSGVLYKAFLRGDFTITLTLGFVVSAVLMIFGALAVYGYITRYSFKLPGKGLSRYRMFFLIGFVLYFSGTLGVRMLMDDIRLFQVNVFIPFAVFAAAYLIIKGLGDKTSSCRE